MAVKIMFQGTSSNVGKSILCTALCRILLQDGLLVAPFKAQNMALNSFVTKDGGEMGRAQVAQAEAAGIEPEVCMNPVLLKPTGNSCSQVILKGRAVGNMSAREYHQGYSLQALGVVQECLAVLDETYEALVIEGAGSPAEVNLKANDIVNMRVAKIAQAPVVLVADIDRGGALASVVGTLELLEPDERELVKGIIINKFRGDIRLLEPALTFLEARTGKKVLGVIPHLEKLGIDDEDSVCLEQPRKAQVAELDIAVLRTPKISNFTDFAALKLEPDVNVRYVQPGEKIGRPDLVILPGSKNTVEDMFYLRQEGYEAQLHTLVEQGVPVIGICGGYQMLGKEIHDPEQTESNLGSIPGLGLLPAVTTFAADKITRQVTYDVAGSSLFGDYMEQFDLQGYEIHMGRTEAVEELESVFKNVHGENCSTHEDGLIRQDGLVMGSYMHGLFDNDHFRRQLLNRLRTRKGLAPIVADISQEKEKQASYDRLAAVVRENLDMPAVYEMMGLRL